MNRSKEEWSIEAHCCRACFGRILSREIDADGKRRYRCSNCGLEVDGHKPSVLCACGAKMRKGKGQMVSVGLVCHENQRKGVEFPAEIVASIGGFQA